MSCSNPRLSRFCIACIGGIALLAVFLRIVGLRVSADGVEPGVSVIFSDGFEGDLGAWVELTRTTSSRAAITTSPVHSGSQAVALVLSDLSDSGYVALSRTLPATTNVRVRSWIYDFNNDWTGVVEVDAPGSAQYTLLAIPPGSVYTDAYGLRFNTVWIDRAGPRSPGWHAFDLLVTEGGTMARVDGQVVERPVPVNTFMPWIHEQHTRTGALRLISPWTRGIQVYDDVEVAAPPSSTDDLILAVVDDFLALYGGTDFSPLYPTLGQAMHTPCLPDMRSLAATAMAFALDARTGGGSGGTARVPISRQRAIQLISDTLAYGQWDYDDINTPGLFYCNSLTTSELALSAWIIWWDLPQELRAAVKARVVADAERYVNQPPRSGYVDDSKAEENAWTAKFLALAANMFPFEPRASAWEAAARCFAFHSITNQPTTYCGHTTQTVHPDFTLDNHHLSPNPLYADVVFQELSCGALTYRAAGRVVPPEFVHNMAELWNRHKQDIDWGRTYYYLVNSDWEAQGWHWTGGTVAAFLSLEPAVYVNGIPLVTSAEERNFLQNRWLVNDGRVAVHMGPAATITETSFAPGTPSYDWLLNSDLLQSGYIWGYLYHHPDLLEPTTLLTPMLHMPIVAQPYTPPSISYWQPAVSPDGQQVVSVRQQEEELLHLARAVQPQVNASSAFGPQIAWNSAPVGRLSSADTLNASSALPAVSSPVHSWYIEMIDYGGESSLKLDEQGYPRVAYARCSELAYAWYDGTDWHVEVVDHLQYLVDKVSLALDELGRPHISYHDWMNVAGLKYAWHDGADWHIEVIDAEGWGPSLALDETGRPHVSYDGWANFAADLKYAWHDGAHWQIETVDDSGGDGHLALDRDGRPHIVYNGDNGLGEEILKYAWHDGTGWHTEVAIDTKGWGLSLALGRDGHPHISYEGGANSLKYAWHDGTDWHIETAVEGTVGFPYWWASYPSLALDEANRPHISYCVFAQILCDGLGYAWRSEEGWHIEVVDGSEWAGYYTSLAVDQLGQPHISYYHQGDYELKYARLNIPYLDIQATPGDGLRNNAKLTYTLAISGPGLDVRLWDPLPSLVEYVTGSITSTVTPAAIYSPTAHAIAWEGTIATDTLQTIRFQVTPGITGTAAFSLSQPIVNTAWLTDTYSGFSVSATSVVNGWHAYLPLALSSYTPPLIHNWQPALSPDGQQIVFVRQEVGGRSDVFLMDADGSGLRNLTQTPDADEETPVFSPDGSMIAFASNREGQWDIYLANVSGTNVMIGPVISRSESDERHPSFSPDGDLLAFSSNREAGNWDLYTSPIAGGTWTRLTTDPAVERFPVFSADGETLAYRREVEGDSELYVMDVTSQTVRRLTNSPGFDGYPALTPDGSGVAFVSGRSGDLQLHSMNIAGAGVLTLTNRSGYRAHTPRLSSDGRTLIYAATPIAGTYAIYTTSYRSPLETLANRGATDTLGLCDWTSGVFAVGWGTAWRGTGDDAYARKIQDWVDSCATDTYTITHVNDGLLGYAALMAYQFDPQPAYVAFAQRVADYLMNTAQRTSDGTLTHIGDTVWDDTLISVVPFLVEMERVTGDQLYLDEAATQLVRHAAILQDATGLYRHAWDESEGTYLSSSYWARGNSWNMIASAQILDALPVTHTLRSQIVTIAQSQAQALVAWQDASGLWHTVVNRPDFYLESSGTAGIAYGLNCGIQQGWLPQDLDEHVQAAWLGLWQKVSADGTLTDVSAPTGPMANEQGYNAVPHDGMELYGQGMGLLALSPYPRSHRR